MLRPIFLALAIVAILLAALLTWAIVDRNPTVLQALGNVLCVNEPLNRSDLIYILGGDFATRIPHAANLYKKGFAPKIVIPYEHFEKPTPGMPHFSALSLSLLVEAGIPENDVFIWKVEKGVSSTADEMRALALYLKTFPTISNVIIVTSEFHSRRARFTANRLVPFRTTIQVSGVQPRDWQILGWWHSPLGRQMVAAEWKKLIYYYPRYLLGWWF